MYRSIADFQQSWTSESEATLKVLRNLSDESLHQSVSPEGRTIARLAWHIATAIPEMLGKVGLHVEGVEENAEPPATAAAIADGYDRAAASVSSEVSTRWVDGTLDESVDMYGETWTKGFVLSALVAHQIHHRGQLTVLMRQAGLRVPGIYGPAKEEWADIGLPAQL